MDENEGNALVELVDVRKAYGQEVLGIDKLVLNKGLIYGVMGPSGAGKTTLLRIINLLTAPCSGTYYFCGDPVPDRGPERLKIQRRMGFVFQKTLLFRDSVWNNVAYGLRARGYRRADIDKRVTGLLEQVGMKDLAARSAHTLSGGEAQRVAVARAVAFDPEILLLDEPTANLDPRNVELIEEMVCKMNRSTSMTVVVVTHNVFQARRIADEVIFIDGGKIVEMGPAKRVFTAPEYEKTRLYVEGRMTY